MPVRPDRYSAVAIILHWLIAVAILSMIPMGWWMTWAIEQPQTQALAYGVFQVHKAVGFLILALTVVRLVWRLTHPVPALPNGMKTWEQFAARATHVAFYGLMLGLPLTGWLYVSSGWAVSTDQPLEVPTSWFGLFIIPHIGLVEAASEPVRRTVSHMSMSAHSLMAWGAVILVGLHVGAALKHQFINRDGVLAHMVPVLPHGEASPAPEASAGLRWFERSVGVSLVLALGLLAAVLARPLPLDTASGAPSGAAEAAVVADAATVPGTTQAWSVDMGQSAIRFAGTHSGQAFNGQFENWTAEVWFDSADLAGSRAVVTVRTASARTGDATKDGALKGAEWFNPGQFATARFEADAFRHLGGNRFEARGVLRIKAVSLPVVLPFTFDEAAGLAMVKGQLELDRTALDLGMASDATGNWVSTAIQVEIEVQARRAD